MCYATYGSMDTYDDMGTDDMDTYGSVDTYSYMDTFKLHGYIW